MNELGNTPADKDYKPSGISRAEERALEAYPNEHFIDHTYAEMCRGFYEEGYEQAEEDLALTWEDMRKIIRIDEEMTDDPEAHPEWMEEQPFYEEILKRYLEAKR